MDGAAGGFFFVRPSGRLALPFLGRLYIRDRFSRRVKTGRICVLR